VAAKGETAEEMLAAHSLGKQTISALLSQTVRQDRLTECYQNNW
jgi:hypothetical protein